jgi:hypothetical protein
MKYVNSIMAVVFTGGGIGLLISPAFVEKMMGWNAIGFACVAIGWFFMGRAFDST